MNHREKRAENACVTTTIQEQTAAHQSPARRLRSLPVPVAEPAAGERRPVTVPATQGALALSFSAVERIGAQDPLFGPQPTSSTALPDPEATCAALVRAVVEVLGGVRPATQLVRWMSHDVHTALTRRAALAARVNRSAPPGLRAAVVRGVRTCVPADGVVEASAVVLDAHRVRAVAVRLEGLDGRWRATALEVG